MGRMFRLLKPNEIEVRTQSVKANGAVLLLYKDARCDMNILDETVGAFNWKREHTRDNANCIVSVYDESKNEWVSKEDTGSESNTEKEKGLASDSFKRACFNWGIGRELYTSPFIWVSSDKLNIVEYKGKKQIKDNLTVSKVDYDDSGNIKLLEIKNDKGKVVYTHGVNNSNKVTEKSEEPKVKLMSKGTGEAIARLSKDNDNNKQAIIKELRRLNKRYEDLTQTEATAILSKLEKEKLK